MTTLEPEISWIHSISELEDTLLLENKRVQQDLWYSVIGDREGIGTEVYIMHPNSGIYQLKTYYGGGSLKGIGGKLKDNISPVEDRYAVESGLRSTFSVPDHPFSGLGGTVFGLSDSFNPEQEKLKERYKRADSVLESKFEDMLEEDEIGKEVY